MKKSAHSNPSSQEADAPTPTERAGWRVKPWCRSVGIGVTKFYALKSPIAPLSVYIGRSRIVREPPGQFLDRVAALQGEQVAGGVR